MLHYIVGTRLRRGLLTVVDATNVQRAARASLVRWPRRTTCSSTRSCSTCPRTWRIARNADRPDRTFGDHVVARQQRDLKRSLKGLRKEGFRRVHVLHGVDEIEAATDRPASGRGTTAAT